MNITDNLIRIKEGKDDIIKSLKNKGVEIPDNTLINEIPTIIDNAEIGGGGGDTPSVPELTPKYEGASVFRIEVPEDNYEFAINLCNDATKATYDVDWGDGSLESGLTTDEQHHIYSKSGVYDVNVYNISKDISLGGTTYISNSADTYSFLFNNLNNDKWYGRFVYKKNEIKCITNLIIGNGVTSIGGSAFSGCSSLTSITIPEGVTSIGGSAFSGCSSLTSITIPEGVTSIAEYAFSDCSSLTSITIPEGVTSIGGYAFSDCSSLTSITIPEGVTSIGGYAFSGCKLLCSIKLPQSLKSVNQNTFGYCSTLQNIIISENVTYFDYNVFTDCYMLKTITCLNPKAPTIQSSSFLSGLYKYTKRYLYVPKDSQGYNEGNWKKYLIDKGWELKFIEEIVEEPKTPTIIKTKMKYNLLTITPSFEEANLINTEIDNNEITYYFDDKITELVENMFCNSYLTNIEIPETVKYLSYACFRSCENLKGINIPDSVTYIGDYAFYQSKIEYITFPSQLTTIYGNTFQNCRSLKNITSRSMVAPEITSYTFSTAIPFNVKDCVLRVPEGATGYDEGYWKSTLLDKGFTLEYIPTEEL